PEDEVHARGDGAARPLRRPGRDRARPAPACPRGGSGARRRRPARRRRAGGGGARVACGRGGRTPARGARGNTPLNDEGPPSGPSLRSISANLCPGGVPVGLDVVGVVAVVGGRGALAVRLDVLVLLTLVRSEAIPCALVLRHRLLLRSFPRVAVLPH